MVKLIVDCLGGDHSPDANIEGAYQALKEKSDLHLILVGNENTIDELSTKYNINRNQITIVNAPEEVSHELKPTDAIRQHITSSMVKSFNMLREDDSIKGMITLGNSGVALVGSVFKIGRLKNVMRPAFCPILPTMNRGIVGICDSGANVESSPQMIDQFATMGSLYIKEVYNIKNPRVALLNVGTEETKGDKIHQEAYVLLKNNKNINFVGNMESRDLLSGKYDLVVCDGYGGNVLIKSTEGACLEMLKMLKRDFMFSLKNKIGALLMKKTIMKEVEFMDYNNYGGSVLLGCKKIIVKGHGSSKAKAVYKCILQAYDFYNSSLLDKIENDLDNI